MNGVWCDVEFVGKVGNGEVCVGKCVGIVWFKIGGECSSGRWSGGRYMVRNGVMVEVWWCMYVGWWY